MPESSEINHLDTGFRRGDELISVTLTERIKLHGLACQLRLV